jgi:hypothetical protein
MQTWTTKRNGIEISTRSAWNTQSHLKTTLYKTHFTTFSLLQRTFSPVGEVTKAPSFLSAVNRVAMRPNAIALLRILNIPHSETSHKHILACFLILPLLIVFVMAVTAPFFCESTKQTNISIVPNNYFSCAIIELPSISSRSRS